MPMTEKKKEASVCSFCNRADTDEAVTWVIISPDRQTFICDKCVLVCVDDIKAAEDKRRLEAEQRTIQTEQAAAVTP
jgi:predicted Fe-S protein YdhL (DUF1289 family)